MVLLPRVFLLPTSTLFHVDAMCVGSDTHTLQYVIFFYSCSREVREAGKWQNNAEGGCLIPS